MAKKNLIKARVTNPSPELVYDAGKAVVSFGVGAAVGGIASAPILDAIDDRVHNHLMRGLAKLGVSTLVVATASWAVQKPSARALAPLLASAATGMVSRTIISGVDDLMGRGITTITTIDVEPEAQAQPAMAGTLFHRESQVQPAMAGTLFHRAEQPAMAGTAAFGSFRD